MTTQAQQALPAAKAQRLPIQTGEVLEIALNKLKASPRNVRRVGHSAQDIEARAASIRHKGLLQPLVVEPEFDAGGEASGFYLVTIGEGRRQALRLLAKRKLLGKAEPVRCVVDTLNDPGEISLDENTSRCDDHIDNAFITDSLIKAIRARSPHSQLIVSTHNANIPVLGDAKLVVQLTSDGRNGSVEVCKPLDDEAAVEAITSLMEGGIDAFRKRAKFYDKSPSMTRDEANAALVSDATEVRLRAARFFSRSASAEDSPQINTALKKETVPWIRRALQSALTRAGQAPGPVLTSDLPTGDALDGLDAQQIYAKAAEEVADSLIHELAPVVGLLRVALPKELDERFKTSQSKLYLDQLHRLMTAVRALKRASAVPNYKDVQLAELITSIIEAALNPDGVLIQTAGPSRLTVSADKDQLTLAIGNGLRNALEAVKLYANTAPARIVITWGATQSDNFVVIKDNGPGFRGDPAAALKLGATSKSGHVGFGLALAHQAILSMQGDIVLKNDQDGAHFEIRWFRDNEDPIR